MPCQEIDRQIWQEQPGSFDWFLMNCHVLTPLVDTVAILRENKGRGRGDVGL